MNEKRKGGFAFLGSDLRKFVFIVVVIALSVTFEKVLGYQYLILQKEVQEGILERWHEFLGITVISVFVSGVNTLANIFVQMWIIKVQKFNFFKRYDNIIQQEGKIKVCLMKFEFENAKVSAIIESAVAIISICYTFKIMGIVEMTVPLQIGCLLILAVGVGFGVFRGVLQQKADAIGSDISARQQLLSNFFMISSRVLDDRLVETDKKFWEQIRMQLIKNCVRLLPDIIKTLFFISLLWNLTDLKLKPGETPYSYSCIILTVFGYIVQVSNGLGNIVEDVSKVIKYKNDPEIKALDEEENIRLKEIESQTKNVRCDDNGITITTQFTANVILADLEEANYYIPESLNIGKGQIVMLEGENGTGKSRLNQLLKEIISNTIWYNSRTNMSNVFIENFRSQNRVDYSLIKRLAIGLGLKRVPKNKDAMEMLILDKQINGADRQLLVALQILYFATIEHRENPNQTQLIILDEILGNVSEANAPKVMEFIAKVLRDLKASAIIVTHAHKDLVYGKVDNVWSMIKEEDKIKIVEKA